MLGRAFRVRVPQIARRSMVFSSSGENPAGAVAPPPATPNRASAPTRPQATEHGRRLLDQRRFEQRGVYVFGQRLGRGPLRG